MPPGQYVPPGSRGVDAMTASVSGSSRSTQPSTGVGQRPASRHAVAQRVELAGLAPDQQVGPEGVDGGGDLEVLAGLDAQPGDAVGAAVAQGAAVLARPRPGPVGAGHRAASLPGRVDTV